jgi:hypothetical protein
MKVYFSLLAALLFSVAVAPCAASAVEVRLVKTTSGFQLLRSGTPYVIKGAGGSGSMEKLKAIGGNSVRTWSAEKLGPVLDEAQKLGMTVTVGIWLGHERHGFNYSDAEQVAKQTEMVRETVLKFKDHPAVLLWALGNEMEGPAGDNAAIWSHINSLAAMVKRLDPAHPTMTVIAEIGGAKVKNVHRLCPEIDVVGINSYAGAASLPRRYKEAGGTKPYVLTEFGPPGTWESPKTSWGAVIEPTSTEKALSYRKAWDLAVTAEPICLGGYAFTWGHKQEATATWFGMLLPDGTKLGAADALAAAWTGNAPDARSPEIASLKVSGAAEIDPGVTVKAALDSSDPGGNPLRVRWVLQPEAERYGSGGDAEAALPTLPEAIIRGDLKGAEIKLPKEPGGYRLYAYVENGKGGAAVANVPLLVKGAVKLADGAPAKLPLVVYDEATREKPAYFPTGWMGNLKAVKMDEAWAQNPHSGKTSARFEYGAAADWAGVVWQNPGNDWGDLPGGWNLTGAKRLLFWARGDKGGEVLAFQFGLLGRDKKFFDTAQGKVENVRLTTEWKEYSIDLTGKDLKRVKTGFAWVVAGQGAPVVFYLDDVRFE